MKPLFFLSALVWLIIFTSGALTKTHEKLWCNESKILNLDEQYLGEGRVSIKHPATIMTVKLEAEGIVWGSVHSIPPYPNTQDDYRYPAVRTGTEARWEFIDRDFTPGIGNEFFARGKFNFR